MIRSGLAFGLLFSIFASSAVGQVIDQTLADSTYNTQKEMGTKAPFIAASTQAQELKLKFEKPKNIILLIGDGMGVPQIYSAYTQNRGKLNLEQFRHIGFSKTYSADNYITDSGAGGTAIAVGHKTYNGAIGVDTLKQARTSILEHAERNGYATGLVAACAITHATPASFIAHQPQRKMYEEIAADFLKTDIDVFIGGGLKHFTQRADGLNLTDSLKQRGYTIALSMEQVQGHKQGKLGALLYDEHPPTYGQGRLDMLGKGTAKALELLSANKKGFFVMIEGSQIDWAAHDQDGPYTANETVDFDNVVGMALDFARRDGNTLVIVTADHETGGMAINNGNLAAGEMTAAYTSKAHTAEMVPVFAYGPGAELFMGIYENTELFHKMMRAFGFAK